MCGFDVAISRSRGVIVAMLATRHDEDWAKITGFHAPLNRRHNLIADDQTANIASFSFGNVFLLNGIWALSPETHQ